MDDEQMAEINYEPFHSLIHLFADTIIFSVAILNDADAPVFTGISPVYLG